MAQATGVENIIQKSTSLTAEQVQTLLDADFGGSKTVRQSLEEIVDPTTDKVMEKLSQRIGIKFAKDIIINDISMDMIRGITINYAKTFEILPYKDDQNQVYVLTTNPLNITVLDDLRLLFKKRVTPILTTKVKL